MRSLVSSRNVQVQRFGAAWFSAFFAALLLSVALVGCGGLYGVYPATALDPSERIIRARGALDKARSDPLANEVRMDLQRAEQWIVTAEASSKDDKPDERVDLYLSTAEGQLSMIQTHYARRRAEDKLTSRREQAFGPSPLPGTTGLVEGPR